ncbi:hypothetical protein [Deinococcus xinjiangensis]
MKEHDIQLGETHVNLIDAEDGSTHIKVTDKDGQAKHVFIDKQGEIQAEVGDALVQTDLQGGIDVRLKRPLHLDLSSLPIIHHEQGEMLHRLYYSKEAFIELELTAEGQIIQFKAQGLELTIAPDGLTTFKLRTPQ